MKVLVTGATGFIGNYVIQELLHQSFEVLATSIEDANNAKTCSWFSECQYIPCDLNAYQKNYYSFFQKPDLLIHLAWQGLPNYKELFHLENNLFSNFRFLRNMVENGLPALAVTGTCLEYGMQSGVLNESMAALPNNPYAIAKDTLRKYLEVLQKQTLFDFKWIRLFYMYGKGQSTNSILSQLEKSLNNNDPVFNMSGGEQLRDYLPVETVAEYIIKIATQKKVDGIINCCSGSPISIRELVENYLKEKNKEIKLNLGYYPYPDYEPMEFWGDTSKLQKAVSQSEDKKL